MKKNITAGVIFLAIVTFVLVGSLKTNTVSIEPPATENLALPLVSPHESSIAVLVSSPLSAIQSAGNKLLPKQIKGTVNDPTDAMTEDTIKWQVNLGNLSVQEKLGKIALTIPVSGSATLHGRVGAKRKNKGLLGRLEEIAGFTFRETPSFAGTITGTLSPKVNPDWTVNADITANIALSKAEAQLFGKAIKISFRSEIQKVLDSEVKKYTLKLNNYLGSDNTLRQEIDRIWMSLHLSETILKNPPVQIGQVPLSLTASNPQVSNSALSLAVGAQFESKLVMQKDLLPLETTPLPQFSSNPTNNEVSLSVPIGIKLSELGESSFESLGLSSQFEVPGGIIEIKDLSVSGDNGRVFVGIDVLISSSIFNKINTRIYLTGNPVFEQIEQQVKLDQLQYDMNTENTLAKVADFLLKPIVLAELQKRVVFDLYHTQEDFLSIANDKIKKISSRLPKGIQTNLLVESGTLSDLWVDDGWLVALVEVKGTASLSVSNLDYLFNR